MKKVLIISYYWPPAGGPGVQRWLKFVKYLPDFNVQPHVYVPENPHYPILDAAMEKEVSKKTIIIKNKIWEPYKWASFFSNKTQKISSGIITPSRKQSFAEKALLWVRGNLFIPDARVFWVKPSITFLASYIEQHQIETVITTGPPHSMHLIGLGLKKQMPKLKWIADFRDPWTSIGYHKELKLTERSAQKHFDLEKEVMQKADVLLVTSNRTKEVFERSTSQPITVITNGFDVEKRGKKTKDAKFSIAHIGSFLSKRNPRVFWKALQELVRDEPDFKDALELKLVGAVSTEILDTIKEFQLDSFLNLVGYVSHEEAVAAQRSAQVLLLIEIDSEQTKTIIPGKLFEYMAAERPILAVGPEETDMENILLQTNTGVYCKYDEKDKIIAVIKDYFERYKANNLQVNAVGIQQYSRKNLTKQLSELL